MRNRLLIYIVLAQSLLYHAGKANAQCASNMGFENGNFGSWNTATDSLFIQPANRVYNTPGINMAVVNYGVNDAWLGLINQPHPSAGNNLVKIGNRGVRATSDTVYRTYIIDSLSDKLTIYSYGVVELAHDYWGVPINEAPGFGYEIYINGVRIDCLRGSFFCGNVDAPPVWQLGTFRDTLTVRKSTGWGAETMNFACFVGDTIEIRLFTRDCILLGHYAYAYFDVVCGDTSKPIFSQISINDMIAEEELNLYCVPGATLFLEPQTDVCPIYMGNIVWTPAAYIVGPSTLDSAIINVSDSAWIFVEAEFSNYCMTVTIIDSVYVRKLDSDPHDNIPKLTRNFCDCKNDTLDFTGVDVTTITDQSAVSYSLTNEKLIHNPCDKFYHEAFWKNASTQTTINNSTIGATSWSSGNNRGAQGVDSIMPGGIVRYIITPTAGKVFYIGINDNNSSYNNDMDHSIRVNGTNIRAYYGTSNQNDLGTFTGTITVEFRVASDRRVRLYIDGVLEHTYSTGQRANTPVFPDYSGQSNHNPHVLSAYTFGPTKNEKNFNRLQNPAPFEYYLNFVDRCGVAVTDTIEFIPGFSAALLNDAVQCGLDPLNLNMQSSSLIDGLSWSSLNSQGTFSNPGSGTPSNNQLLWYSPVANDYNFKPMEVIVTARSGRCTVTDTGYITVNEIPGADAGPDITTSLDSFVIGGSPSGSCSTCPSGYNIQWSQRNALNDSTVENPTVYRDLIGPPYFVVTIIDPTTGCFSFDTVEVFTSLSNENNFLQTRCLTANLIELDFVLLPDINISHFAVDYSLDGGRNWVQFNRMEAIRMQAPVPMNYKMELEKHENSNAIYRWYALSPTGEKSMVMMLDRLECSDGDVYTLFPNPFNSNIEVHVILGNSAKNHYQVQIMNQYGQVVHEKWIQLKEYSTGAQFQIEGLDILSNGIYFMNIKNNDVSQFKTMIIKSD